MSAGAETRAPSPMERERTVVTGLLVVQLVLWLGFLVHRSPRFPGGMPGTLLGIAGAALMALPSLAYEAVKRIAPLKRWMSARVSLRVLLAAHVYGGIAGSVLAILHTGHRFESVLGMALTGSALLAVFSGYVGRHFLGLVSLDLREKHALLDQLVSAYNAVAAQLAAQPALAAAAPGRGWRRALRRSALAGAAWGQLALGYRASELAASIADLEYAIKTHDLLKRRFAGWLAVHVFASVAFYALLALHVWSSIHFGLRWLH